MAIDFHPFIIHHFVLLFLLSFCSSLVIVAVFKKKKWELFSLYQKSVNRKLALLLLFPLLIVLPGLVLSFYINNMILAEALIFIYQFCQVILIGLGASYPIIHYQQQSGIHVSLPIASFILILPLILVSIGIPLPFLFFITEEVSSLLWGVIAFFFVLSVINWPNPRNQFYILSEKHVLKSIYFRGRMTFAWLLILLGTRANMDNDKVAYSVLDHLIKINDPILTEAIELIDFQLITDDEENRTYHWRKQGDLIFSDKNFSEFFSVRRFTMTNSEFYSYIKRVRTLFIIECLFLGLLSITFFLFQSGVIQILGVYIPIILVIIACVIGKQEDTIRCRRMESDEIIKRLDYAFRFFEEKRAHEKSLLDAAVADV